MSLNLSVFSGNKIASSTLAKTSLLVGFASGSKVPSRSLFIRLGLALTGSLVLAGIAVKAVSTWRLPADIPIAITWLILVIVVQAFVGLAVYVGRQSLGSKNKFSQLVSTWPVSAKQSWLINNCHLIVLAGLALIIISPAIVVIGWKLKLTTVMLFAAISLASLSGLGLGRYQPRQSNWLGSLLIGLVVLCEVNLISQIINTPSWIGDDRYLYGTLIILIISPIAWLSNSVELTSLRSTKQSQLKLSLPSWHVEWPSNLWILPKIIRHSQIQKSLSSTGALSILLASLIVINRIQLPEAGIFGVAFSCLVCICLSDFRAVIRRTNAPEIVGLQGTTYVWWRVLVVGGLAAAVVTAPLGLTMLAASVHPWLIASRLLAGWMLGVGLGWLIATVLVPQPGDVSGQFFAALISLAGITILDKLSGSQIWPSLILITSFSCLMLLGAWQIELLRNKYYWKGENYVQGRF